jgi:mono/diheme cytochrome c family protein
MTIRNVVIALLLLAVIGAAVFWFVTRPAVVAASALGPHTPNVDNGRAMFYAGGCSSCHATPDQDDKTKLGGGMALKTVFGTFYPPNISSDPKDGIGGWSEANFVTAMWKGTSPEGEHYYPAFPYTSFQHMTLSGVRDLFGYLKSLPAVSGQTPDHDLPFYLKIRRLVGGWKFLFLHGGLFQPDSNQSTEWNRGAYLVNGPGHCAECHSPRNFLGAIIEGKRFTGGPDPEGGDNPVPDITQAGIGNYSQADIERVLETGDTPDGDSVCCSMAKEVGSTSKLSAADRTAMAVYIKSLPPVQGAKP